MVENFPMTRVVRSGSPSLASARLRGGGASGLGSGRAHIGDRVHGTRQTTTETTTAAISKPTQYPYRSMTELTGNVRVVDADVILGIRTAGRPPA